MESKLRKIEKQVIPIMPGQFCPDFISAIGTCNEDGTPHLCGHSWVSFNPGPPKSIIFSTYVKPTLDNIFRTGEFSLNFGTGAMKGFLNDICAGDGDANNNGLQYGYTWGEKAKVPILDVSPFATECKVIQTHKLGEYNIFFAEILSRQLAKNLVGIAHHSTEENRAWQAGDAYFNWLLSLNVKDLDPLLWFGHWYRIGEII
ncbi:MAG: flavin reductase [Clostridiales bacterium]|jgi:flavin reductase (DIM6/NTAB) family NADH-FMN oxidoreductase RutF|nr:flavin reductase [Clostridiales bacterium]